MSTVTKPPSQEEPNLEGQVKGRSKTGALTGLMTPVRRFGGWESTLLVLMVLEITAFSQGSLGFFGGGAGVLSQFQQFAPYAFCALGLGMVILTGGIDLSVGAVASLTGVVMAVIWSHGVSIWVAAILALAVAGAIGAIIGVIVVLGGLDPWIVTLAMMFVLQSVAQVVVGTPKPYLFPDSFIQIGQGAIWKLPYSFIGFIVLALIVGHVVGAMPFGRKLIMIGSNRQAAVYAGVRRGRVIITVHILGSLFAGMAGVVMSSMFASARADLGQNLMMPALTAIVLGGVDIFGGYGHVRGIVLGVLTIGFLQQGLMLYGVNSINVQLIVGAVLLVAASVKNMLGAYSIVDAIKQWRPIRGRPATAHP